MQVETLSNKFSTEVRSIVAEHLMGDAKHRASLRRAAFLNQGFGLANLGAQQPVFHDVFKGCKSAWR